MEPYIHRKTLVKYTRDHLPQYLHEAYLPEFPAALRNKDDHLPGTLLHQGPIPKICIDKGYTIPPVCFFWGVVPYHYLDPRLDVF